MSGVVHVVDYGIGNLYSVGRAIEKAGGEVRLVESHAEIVAADRLILPGVGAFRDGMAGLAQAGLDDAVRQFAESGLPLLGIFTLVALTGIAGIIQMMMSGPGQMRQLVMGGTALMRTSFATRPLPWRATYRAASPPPVEWPM